MCELPLISLYHLQRVLPLTPLMVVVMKQMLLLAMVALTNMHPHHILHQELLFLVLVPQMCLSLSLNHISSLCTINLLPRDNQVLLQVRQRSLF